MSDTRLFRPYGRLLIPLLAALLLAPPAALQAEDQSLRVDLLIVGGNESACAAAVQAARLGVKSIALVNDIDWLGGQFSAEGVGPVDERTLIGGQSTNLPRSGLFLEIIERIREHNRKEYGVPAPGNSWSATETITPAAAARLFEDLLAPYAAEGSGQIRVLRGWQPARVTVEGSRVAGVVFERTDGGAGTITVAARLTIDSSDWGDVIRLGGAKYLAGVDPHSRFNEPSAPKTLDDEAPQEMNSITWSVTLREADHDAVIARPARYDDRSFELQVPPWVDSDMRDGIYSNSGCSVYTQRRLVDRRHFGLPRGVETLQLNSTPQDYPLCQLPSHVAEALEATEAGASRKNIVDMTPAQRRIIFADAKQRSLAFLHYLQTTAHAPHGDLGQSFRSFELTDEFGTPDRLPPKPYIREGLRLAALDMLREQDIRAAGTEPLWAGFMPNDAVFGFQFHIDFHPTRRWYVADRPGAAWVPRHAAGRNWNTHTDRAMFPLRGLVPVDRDGLLGASKNIGVSSIAQAALRLHGQMMLCGQASGTLAWLCLRDGIEPRVLAADVGRVREVQRVLVRGCRGPGVTLWPYQDLQPDHAAFEAANLMTALGLWKPDARSVLFRADERVSPDEWRLAIERAPRSAREVLRSQAPRTRADAVQMLLTHVPLEAVPLPVVRALAR
jgi:hypothetical protein